MPETTPRSAAVAGRKCKLVIGTFGALVVGAIGGGIAVATLDAGTAQAAQSPTPSNAAVSTIPRDSQGRPDFSGIWESLSGADYDLEPHGGRSDAPPGRGVVRGGKIPYLADALAQREHNFKTREVADASRLNCYSLGVPRSVYYPAPFQIFQRPRDLTLVGQFGAVRTINTNDTQHPDGPIGFWQGDSRATWDGDTLVVSVQDFTDETWLDRSGNYHSEALQVTERWRFLDANTIAYEATLVDPEIYAEPWTVDVILYRHQEPNFQLIENYCFTLEYDEFYPFPRTQQPGVQP